MKATNKTSSKTASASSPSARILVVEPVRSGEEHQAFNTSMLLCSRYAFLKHHLTFSAQYQHIESIQNILPALADIEFHPLTIAPRYGNVLKRLRPDWHIVKYLLGAIDHNTQTKVIFTSITCEIVCFLSVLSHLRKLPPILAVLHADLQNATRRYRYNLIARALSLRTAILMAPTCIRFIVLERSILDTLVEKDPVLAARFDVFPHPLPPDLLTAPAAVEKNTTPPIRIGLLGLCTPQKGLYQFLNLAKIAHSLGESSLHFEIIGRLHPDSVQKAEPYIRFLSRPPALERIPRREFVAAVSELDYVVFLFEGRYYDMTASGVLLDCIAIGIPLIFRPNRLMQYLEAEVGPIGIPCQPGDEVKVVQQLQGNFNPKLHHNHRQNMLKLRSMRTIENLALRLKELIGTINLD